MARENRTRFRARKEAEVYHRAPAAACTIASFVTTPKINTQDLRPSRIGNIGKYDTFAGFSVQSD
ncbi:hypothetical protein MB84_23175 [Pandoraea oxalativorans]|uniref:Uncharacterized protein n=2 Tax=Pandoraea oxalativorans TaxID=573737 RepID=A0A0E3YDW6_9BURK|nr:hypothetical protein MB84_23175 [Pandoraea oxalativorans]